MEWNKIYKTLRTVLITLSVVTIFKFLFFNLFDIVELVFLIFKLSLIGVNFVFLEKLNRLIKTESPLNKQIRLLEFLSYISIVNYCFVSIGIVTTLFYFEEVLRYLGVMYIVTTTVLSILSAVCLLYTLNTFKYRKQIKGVYYNSENKNFTYDNKKPFIPWYGMLLYTVIVGFYFTKLILKGNTGSDILLLFIGLIVIGILGVFYSLFIEGKIIK